MEYKYQYKTQEERSALMLEHNNLILVEEQNLIEGNFLMFADTKRPTPIVYVSIPEETILNLENRVSATEIGLAQILGV